MDELELLKKDWKNQEDTLPELSYDQLYKMLLKKSSSIVKWIFIISVLEFVLWISLEIFANISGPYGYLPDIGVPYFAEILSGLSNGIVIYFVIRFYLSYKRIQITDSSKVLMRNILNTRRTVQQYVWVNISFFAIGSIVMIVQLLYNDSNLGVFGLGKQILMIVISFVLVGVFVGLIFGFYRLIYGLLTKKLQKNYDELERIEL